MTAGRAASEGTPPAAAWVASCVVAILFTTLTPSTSLPGSANQFFSVATPTARDWLDVCANIALYVPFGVLLSARNKSAWAVVLAGMVLSSATELLQFAVPGRDPSLRDILVNTAGAWVGVLLLKTPVGNVIERLLAFSERRAAELLHPGERLASACFIVWSLMVAIILMTTALLVSPIPPPGDRYFVWSPTIDRAPGPLRIGGNTDPDGFFKGLIDEVRVYDRAESVEQIRADMGGEPLDGAVPGRGLVASYSFDEDAGTIAHDKSGHGHHGLIENAPWVMPGRYGGGLSFDGHSSLITVAGSDDLDLREGMTLEAWVRPLAQPEVRTTVIAHASETYFLRGSSTGDRLLIAAGGRFGDTNNRARLVAARPEGQWTHLAATYDRQAIRLYVNGALEISQVRWSGHQPATVSLNGLSLPFGAIVGKEQMWSGFAGPIDLRASISCGGPQGPAAPVFKVVAPGSVNAISLLAEGPDLLIRSSTRARRLALLSPDFRVPGAFRGCPAEQVVRVAIGGRFQRPTAIVNGRDMPVVGLGIGSAWAFVIHSELLPAWIRAAFASLWLGSLFLPFGFWMRRNPLTAAGGLAFLIGIPLVANFWHIQAVGLIQVLSMCVGVLLGLACQAFFRSSGAARRYMPRLRTTV